MTRSIPGAAARALVAVFCLLAVAGCGGADPADGSGAVDDLLIETAWAAPLDVTTAADPQTAMSVAYADITNSGDEDDALIEVTSDAVRVIEMHETVTSGSSGTMVHVEQIDVRSDSTVNLEPGGLHLMLIGPHESLVAGTSISVRFTFASGSVIDLMVPVIDRTDRPRSDADHHGHDDGHDDGHEHEPGGHDHE